MEPLNKGHFGDSINSADLFFVERFSSLGGSKCYCRNYTGAISRVLCKRFVILCPYLGESTIGVFTVENIHVSICVHMYTCAHTYIRTCNT